MIPYKNLIISCFHLILIRFISCSSKHLYYREPSCIIIINLTSNITLTRIIKPVFDRTIIMHASWGCKAMVFKKVQLRIQMMQTNYWNLDFPQDPRFQRSWIIWKNIRIKWIGRRWKWKLQFGCIAWPIQWSHKWKCWKEQEKEKEADKKQHGE